MFPAIRLQYEACTKNECCVTAGSEAVVFCDRALYAVELFDFLVADHKYVITDQGSC